MAVLAAEAIELAHRSDDPMDLRNALTITSMVAMCEGRYGDALEPYRQGVEICRQLGLTWQLGTSYLNLGTALLHAGFPDEAIANLEEGLRVYRILGDDIFSGRATNVLAHAALGRRDWAQAARLGREALTTARDQAEREGTADALETLAAVAAETGRARRAATLAGAAAAIKETIACRPSPFESAITRPCLDNAQRNVGPQQWQRWWRAGYALTIDVAAELALR
jgi:non-specific serine/threonine protein kinase